MTLLTHEDHGGPSELGQHSPASGTRLGSAHANVGGTGQPVQSSEAGLPGASGEPGPEGQEATEQFPAASGDGQGVC